MISRARLERETGCAAEEIWSTDDVWRCLGDALSVFVSVMSFSEQIELIDALFASWNDCEKVVALYYLLRKMPPIQTKFMSQVILQFAAGISPNEFHEEQANNPG